MKSISIKSIICVLTIAVATITAVAVNADNKVMVNANPDFAEVSKAVEMSQMKESLLNENTLSDGEVVNPKSSPMFGTKDEPKYDMNSAVKVYSIKNINDIANHSDRYYYIVPVVQNNDIVALVTMCKGSASERLKTNIKSLDISEEYRQEMLKKIAEREGKWYAICMEEISDETTDIFDKNSLSKLLKKNDITDVQDMTYFRYGDAFLLEIKTDNGGYIIPAQLSSAENKKFDKEIYSMVEFNKIVSIQ